MKRLTEQLKLDNAVESQALGASTTTGDYFDMTQYRDAMFVLNSGALANTNLIKLEILQAKDESGTDSKAVKDSDGNPIIVEFTNETGAGVDSAKLIAEVQGPLMDTNNGFTHLAAKITSDDASSNLSCDLIRGNARFMPTQDADNMVVA